MIELDQEDEAYRRIADMGQNMDHLDNRAIREINSIEETEPTEESTEPESEPFFHIKQCTD